ncbi:Cytochrome B561 [hydrothermal vent metagenome]|uniref:Cytochrome B561 n=1 Tax=hydrothermal vent metagenome TaxID=652676 RepID=A0A3B0ZGE0_9ZZZZ
MNKKIYPIRWFNTTHHWGVIMITLHWVSALMIVGMLALGLWMVELSYYHNWYHKGPNLHKSIGITLFILTFIRLFWRKFNRCPLPLGIHNSQEKKLATAMHKLLYVLLIFIMVSGYLISTADGRAISVFNYVQVPALIHGIEQQEDVAGVVHLWLAISLVSMAALHMMASMKHHFFDHDRTLKRMFGF